MGLALSLPGLAANVVEPVLGILGDVWKRRALILGGGVAFAGALLAFGLTPSFVGLLLASCVLYPASGAFVTLSQATLMDLKPARHEQNMTRWTFSGSLGAVAGPLVLATALVLGGGWRTTFGAFALLTFALVIVFKWSPVASSRMDQGETSFRDGLRALWCIFKYR